MYGVSLRTGSVATGWVSWALALALALTRLVGTAVRDESWQRLSGSIADALW